MASDPRLVRRALESTHSDGMQLQGATSGSSVSNRPRAGTLPSTFHLLSASTPSSLSSSPSMGVTSSTSRADVLRYLANGTSNPTSGSTSPAHSEYQSHPRPALLASVSSASASRLRAGSLQQPFASVSNAFGPNVFNTPSVHSRNTATEVPKVKRRTSVSAEEEIRRRDGDEHVRTLDYLGLVGDGGFGPVGMSQSRSYGDGSLPSTEGLSNSVALGDHSSGAVAAAGRMRSSTIASFNRLPSDQASSSLSRDYLRESLSRHAPSSSLDSNRLLYASNSNLASILPSPTIDPFISSRPRAATIGILDDQKESFMRRRAGTMIGASGSGGSAYDEGLSRNMSGLSVAEDTDIWAATSGLESPEIHSSSTPVQPSRCLWIGNLDINISASELRAAFAVYGSIDSVKLVPEKDCGFVNFVEVQDAIFAKEDILNRLGGQVLPSIGPLRIGFGRETNTSPPSGSTGYSRSTSTSTLPTLNPMPTTNDWSMSDMHTQTMPTRALWVGLIPSTTTSSQLLAVFAPFGSIESARVLNHKSCGFVNFERLDDAISALNTLNGHDILGSKSGSVRVGFAKVPSKPIVSPFDDRRRSPSPAAAAAAYNAYTANSSSYSSNFATNLGHLTGASAVPLQQQLESGMLENYRSQLVVGLIANVSGGGGSKGRVGGKDAAEEEDEVVTLTSSMTEMQLLMRELSGDDSDVERDVLIIGGPRRTMTYYTDIPATISDPTLSFKYGNADAPRLKDLKKRLDSTTFPEDADEMALTLLDECVALSSDYIGNTLIQKLVERCTVVGRMAMLERIAPYLATIGIHKNGTWAAQKIIQCAQTAEEYAIIGQHLRPFAPPLLLNDFGNYVVQGALRFGFPASDFIFDSMVDRCWEIGSGRFGARSIRQILDTPSVSLLHIKRVAIAIILNSIPLVASPNGTLLVTWLLESSQLPRRYSLLASRMIPSIAHLLTHKLASIALLKLINQTVEPEASRSILESLMDDQSTALSEVLGDQSHGISSISRIINSTFIPLDLRAPLLNRVQSTLSDLEVTGVPSYRKLIEDLSFPFQGIIAAAPIRSTAAMPHQQMPSSRKDSNGYSQSGRNPGWQNQQFAHHQHQQHHHLGPFHVQPSSFDYRQQPFHSTNSYPQQQQYAHGQPQQVHQYYPTSFPTRAGSASSNFSYSHSSFAASNHSSPIYTHNILPQQQASTHPHPSHYNGNASSYAATFEDGNLSLANGARNFHQQQQQQYAFGDRMGYGSGYQQTVSGAGLRGDARSFSSQDQR